MAALCGATAHEVVRLERLAEQVLASGTDDVAGEIVQRLTAARDTGAVGAKSIAAYRVGLDLPATKPSDDDLRGALPGVDPRRIADPVVSAWLAHTALEAGLPLQFHVGYGDHDVDLLTCDPLRLTAFLRATEERGVPVLLLHCYPFHRHASYLAQVFGHVFMDLGLATHNTGAFSTTLLRETLELVPFGKLLFSTDAYGLAELYLLGAVLFRSAMATVLGELIAAGDMTEADAGEVAALVAPRERPPRLRPLTALGQQVDARAARRTWTAPGSWCQSVPRRSGSGRLGPCVADPATYDIRGPTPPPAPALAAPPRSSSRHDRAHHEHVDPRGVQARHRTLDRGAGDLPIGPHAPGRTSSSPRGTTSPTSSRSTTRARRRSSGRRTSSSEWTLTWSPRSRVSTAP